MQYADTTEGTEPGTVQCTEYRRLTLSPMLLYLQNNSSTPVLCTELLEVLQYGKSSS